MSWVFLVLLYSFFKGIRDVIKKKALIKNTVMEVLFVYTFLTFICCIPEAPEALTGMPVKYFFLIGIKSLAIFIAWICSFKAVDKMPISIYGVLDLSRIIFSTSFGILIIGEKSSVGQIIGMLFIISGLLLMRIYPIIKQKITIKNGNGSYVDNEDVKPIYVIAVLVSCLFNAFSGCLDKLYMRDLNSSQLQFWYMLYLVIFYGLYFVVTRTKISKSIWKNGWIYLMSIIFFLGDKALFIANQNPASKVTIMTLVKQSTCIVTILAGKFVFKEKNIGYKIVCACIVIIGIMVSVLY